MKINDITLSPQKGHKTNDDPGNTKENNKKNDKRISNQILSQDEIDALTKEFSKLYITLID